MSKERQPDTHPTPKLNSKAGLCWDDRLVRLIDPAPQWEENPTPPDDMAGAEPEEIEGRWHWVLNSLPNAKWRGGRSEFSSHDLLAPET